MIIGSVQNKIILASLEGEEETSPLALALCTEVLLNQ